MEVQRLSFDIISSLPLTIIETILCLVPIRDAVRTSILSRNWRYKWLRIPKLLFDVDDMVDKSNGERNGREHMTNKLKVFYAIYQVLLLHQGPILEFTLFMKADNSCVEIDQLMLHLSMKNTVKKLTLDLDLRNWYNRYQLPPSFFSLQQLTELSLCNCKLYLNPAFYRLGSLKSLSLIDVNIYRETFLHLISTSPLLERLSLMLWDSYGDILRIDTIELFNCLPMLEHLSFWCWTFEECLAGFSAQDVIPQELPTTLIHLKSLCMLAMLFVYKFQILGLFILIRSSPNLEKLKLEQECTDPTDLLQDPEINSLDDYSDIWLENLQELEMENFFNLKLELEFVKLIMAKSPMLKKVRIRLSKSFEKDEELKMLRTLIRCQRASPAAEIVIESI